METLRPSTKARQRLVEHPAREGLSVCCMTSGRRPALLAGVLEPLRRVADEIVVAAEAPRARAVHEAVSGLADSVLSFPATSPADRPIAWLFRSCAGRWIFNVDDDEGPSPRLVAALPALLERRDVTHAWIARRWVYPTRNSYIVSAPWGTEFQLRLVRADERFLQFSDDFHRPVVCHGPSMYVDAPLWHLDTVMNPAADRRRKAASYERERPGMRLAGLSHNVGLYVPELYPDLQVAAVPDEDRAVIAAALAGKGRHENGRSTAFVEATTAEIDREWVGAPFGDDLYGAQLEVVTIPHAMYAGTQTTVDVRVRNRGDRTWSWGREARPEIMLAYRWWAHGAPVPDRAALQTALPLDIRPGASEVVPVHVVPPDRPGRYELEVDLLHHRVRPFAAAVLSEVEVRPRRRLAVIAPAGRVGQLALELGLPPDVEPVVLLRDRVDRDAYGDFETIPALRPYLLTGLEGRGRLRTLASILSRTAALSRLSANHWSQPEYAALLRLRDESDALLIEGPTWEPDAAFGREWAWVAATALLWRLRGKPVFIRDGALPAGDGARERTVRGILGALGRAR